MTHGLLVLIELPATNREGAARYARHIGGALQRAYGVNCTVVTEPVTGYVDSTDTATLDGLVRAGYAHLAAQVNAQANRPPRTPEPVPRKRRSTRETIARLPDGVLDHDGERYRFTATQWAMMTALRDLSAARPGTLISSTDIYRRALGDTGAARASQQGYVRKALADAQAGFPAPFYTTRTGRSGGYRWVYQEGA